jgi:isochorismate synthase
MQTGLAQLADSLLHYCQKQAFALAIWQLPATNKYHFLVSYQPQLLLDAEIEQLPKGFVVAEFENGIKGEKYFLPADAYVAFENSDGADEASKLLEEQIKGFSCTSSQQLSYTTLSFDWQYEKEKQSYEKMVLKAMHDISQGTFKKVVLARKKVAHWQGTFSIGAFFQHLCEKTSNTFNSVVYLPEHGTWIGATPEVLVSKNAQQIFKTIALAGTQKANGLTEKEAIWSQKEIEEQAYVSRYIIDCLKHIRLREFEDIGPKTVRIGNLFHLKTEFLVNLREVHFPNLLGTMLHLLHPTSAVCGMPRETALAFVLENEGFDRELYSGYLGPVNVDNESHIYVNLRCAKITDQITYYAGAGITEDSQPEKEFLETEIKIESLLSFFQNN